jgi:hypothetical protein
MIERRYRQLKIVELGEGADASLPFGSFSRRNELLDVFQPTGKRWRLRPGETTADFEKRIVADFRPYEVDVTS